MVRSMIRKTFPGLYGHLVRLRHGDLAQSLSGRGSRRKIERLLRNGETICINLDAARGFGSTVCLAVQLHAHFEALGAGLRLVAQNPLYTTAERTDMLDI